MKKQKLYVGENYSNGYRGKRILVVGHQKHITEEEKRKYTNVDDYNEENDNEQMINAFLSDEWRSWKPFDRKSLLQFGRMLSGNRYMEIGSEQSDVLWKSIAFCNYLQVPDLNLDARQGKDEEALYRYSEEIFLEYLNECNPERVIVWGVHAYPYVAKQGEDNDGRHCRIHLKSGITAKVLRINHPCRIGRCGYNEAISIIDHFLSE